MAIVNKNKNAQGGIMERGMTEFLNIKLLLITAIYSTFGALVLILQQTSDYMAHLPNTTLAGLGLAMAFFGGVLSYFWERSKTQKASLRTNAVFAVGVGLVVGLITYDRLIVQYEMVNSWLALLFATGFSNQMCLGLMSVVLRKKMTEFLTIPPDKPEEKPVK